MCFMASAMELMCPGVPVTACATMKPRRSKTPAERSPASRTMEVNDVRWSAAACSFTTPMSRLQQTSRVMGSMDGLDPDDEALRRWLISCVIMRFSPRCAPEWADDSTLRSGVRGRLHGAPRSSRHLDDQGQSVVDAALGAGAHDRGGLALLHDGGTAERVARGQSVAIVDGRLHKAAGLLEVRRAVALHQVASVPFRGAHGSGGHRRRRSRHRR